MNESKKAKRDWMPLVSLLVFLGVLVLGAGMIGARSTARQFERRGYVLIEGIDGQAVATVTPIFEEWR